MKTKDLFLRACALCPQEPNEFLGAVGDGVRELLTRYPSGLLAADGAESDVHPPASLDDDCGLDELYFSSLVGFAVAKKRGDAAALSDARASADRAYRSKWRRAARHARVTHTEGGGF